MNLSKELQKLIEIAVADGQISEKEKKVLLKRAIEEGVDEDEFEMYLDSRLLKPKKSKQLFDSWNAWYQTKSEESKKQIKAISLLSVMMIFFMVIGLFSKVTNLFTASKKDKVESTFQSPEEKYGCSNFQDCISKYEFDGAYYFYSEDPLKSKEMLMELISSQVSYWSKEKNFEKAYDVLHEYKIEADYNLNTDDAENEKNIAYNNQANFYNNLLDDLINKMLITDQPKETILNYCKAFKPVVVGNEKNKGFFGGYNSYELSNSPYEKALVKVNEQGSKINKKKHG
jgi:hypothetical protein